MDALHLSLQDLVLCLERSIIYSSPEVLLPEVCQGRLYPFDIQKFDSAGGFVIKWGRGDPPGSSFANSRGVAVAPDGSVYVTEYNGDSVQKWSVGP